MLTTPAIAGAVLVELLSCILWPTNTILYFGLTYRIECAYPSMEQVNEAHWDLLLLFLPLLAVPKVAQHWFQSTINANVRIQQTELCRLYLESMAPGLRSVVRADSILSRKSATCKHLTQSTLP